VEGAATRSPLMLIHGAWLSSRSWDPFAEYFRDRGYDVSAPEWPRKQGDVEELREATEAIEGLGLTEIVDHYEAQIRALDREPILIGHSFGGLIVELLLDRGLARGGVAMSPAPPKGILLLPFSTLKVVSTALAHKSRWHGVVPLTLEEFTYGFVNTFTPEEAKAAYEKYYVPETGQIFFEAGFANFHLHPPTELHFKYEERAPLLIIGADQDHTVPALVSKKQFKKYEKSPAQTDYLEFAGRPHLMMAAEKWAEIAGAIEGWIAGVPEKTGVAARKGRTMVKSVRDAMTEDPRSIGASESVVEAARMMREEHIGSLPITDDEQLVGMITDRDITTRVVAEAADPKTTSVGDVYSRDLISVAPDKDLDEALQLMARHQVRRLPVVENGRLVGMVAQADIALKDNERTGELVEAISEPSQGERR
jgi:CBS domain-containing protein/pimeloyl-ACP methyl ester carboxylesterase